MPRSRRSLKHKKRYQDGGRAWLDRLGVGKNCPAASRELSDHELPPGRWGVAPGSSAEVRRKIQALEATEWVPGTDMGVPGWRAKWEEANHDVRPVKDGDSEPYRNATVAVSPPVSREKRKLGFEESARMNADFASRFSD